MGSINLHNVGGGFSGLLSDLTIDTNKEWGGYDITRIGTIQSIQALFGGVEYTSRSFDLTNNVLSCYEMEDNDANTTVEDSCGTNIGTSQRNTNVMHITGHIESGAFSFDSVNDYINIGTADNLDPGSSKAISFWIKADGNDPGVIYGGYDVNSWNGMGIGISMKPGGGGLISIWNNTNGTWESCTVNVNDGKWHLVVVNYNRGIINVITDGNADNDFIGLWENTYSGDKYIGCDTTCNNLFSYDLDQVIFYDKILENHESCGMYNYGDGTKQYKGEYGGYHSCFGYDIYTYARHRGFDTPEDVVIGGKLQVNDDSYFESDIILKFGGTVQTHEVRAIDTFGIEIKDKDGDVIAIFTDNNTLAIGNITPKTKLGVDGSCGLNSINDAYYIGDIETNSSWRIRIDANDLHFERREAGSWVSKGSFAA